MLKGYRFIAGVATATTGTMVESLYYLDGNREVNLPNLMNSGAKLLIDSTYGSLVHKLNPMYGVGADTLKGIVVDDKNFIISINDSARASTISSFIEGRFNNIKGASNTGKFISSFGNKYIEYKAEQKEENK
ncbi:hypothetical protein [Glaesserella parasuis]|uniref:hypothetical protein n=1 Tax=Glaesserella parasuis TaxID=738 RepID=UPI0024372ECE|nr:hypothetical protein [Glaesserella parasuis]MDG6449175.1 hypothetical protein [Glaesserella parasuis]MDG6476927.1 hypothetical protein [Glaesserella parasuis]MDO9832366.1 hypothetical protein [Glaesserella parasuis]MDP0120868.1 hypothetical protein [Glaesserella parasuis]